MRVSTSWLLLVQACILSASAQLTDQRMVINRVQNARSNVLAPSRVDAPSPLKERPNGPSEPKRLPDLLAEIGRDPRDYIRDHKEQKHELHKELLEKKNKNERQRGEDLFSEETDDLRALMDGINLGVDEWWRPGQVEEEVEPILKSEASQFGDQDYGNDDLVLGGDADYNNKMSGDQQTTPMTRSTPPDRYSLEETESQTSSAGGSYTSIDDMEAAFTKAPQIPGFDSSSEEELVSKGLVQQGQMGEIYWTQDVKGLKRAKGKPSMQIVPGRFESLKYGKNEDPKSGRDYEPTSNYLKPISIRAHGSPIFTADSVVPIQTLQRKDEVDIQNVHGPREIIEQDIDALLLALDRGKRREDEVMRDGSEEQVQSSVDSRGLKLRIQRLGAREVKERGSVRRVSADTTSGPDEAAVLPQSATEAPRQSALPLGSPAGLPSMPVPLNQPAFPLAPMPNLLSWGPPSGLAAPLALATPPSSRYGTPPVTPLDHFPLRQDPHFQQLYNNLRSSALQHSANRADTTIFDFTNDPHHNGARR